MQRARLPILVVNLLLTHYMNLQSSFLMFNTYGNSHVHLLQFELMGLNRRQNKLWKVVWLAVIWTVWNGRNNLVFREVEMEIERLFEMVQICSWNWITAGLQGFSSSFFEWVSNPIQCIKPVYWCCGGAVGILYRAIVLSEITV
ncbi:uncharacterized protein LOC130749311 isoform X2 [Lotus japonicus]|uniref:uncharacterized protein LOC130749311 isoform X2 n=1 Tax=Lotus japonicus TaxID=34305 RepID=UPI00258B3956|nr:uncharacterized protein LOC130749311 isoform X2 [Lotus japonicus]